MKMLPSDMVKMFKDFSESPAHELLLTAITRLIMARVRLMGASGNNQLQVEYNQGQAAGMTYIHDMIARFADIDKRQIEEMMAEENPKDPEEGK